MTSRVAPRLYVIVACHDADRFVGRCLQSLLRQNAEDVAIVVVDDASTDGTTDTIRRKIEGSDHCRLLRLDRRVWAARARQLALASLHARPHDVVVLVDGDDWLLRDDALERVRSFHVERRLLVVYGAHETDGGRARFVQEYPLAAKITGGYRRVGWLAGHPRSFRFGLTTHLREDYLVDPQGRDLRSATDIALFLPLLELAGTRSGLLPGAIYHYNRQNPLSCDRVDAALQHECALELFQRPPYPPLPLEEQRRLLGE